MTAQHSLDQTWIMAMKGVNVGSMSSRKRFLEKMFAQGPKTDRERWWLAKLVHMHRKQIRSDYAVATALAHVDAHPNENAWPNKPKKEKPAPAAKPEPPRSLDLFGQWT